MLRCTMPRHAVLCTSYVCMCRGLQDAGVQPDDVNYVNAHGTSTPVGEFPSYAEAVTKVQDSLPWCSCCATDDVCRILCVVEST